MKTIKLNPIYKQDGSVFYGLGDTANVQPTAEGVNVKLQDGTFVQVVNGRVTVTLPSGQIVTQNGLGDGKTVGSVMMTVGGAVAVFVPIGTIVGAILAAAGALISAFSNGKAAQRAAAEAQKYQAVNIELQNQNAQLDQKINELQNAIIKAKQDLGVSDDGLNGLGWCLINCAKTKAQESLKTAKNLYDTLNKAQEDRISILEKLTAEAERLFVKKKNNNIAYIVSGALLLGAAAFFAYKKL